MQSLNWNLDSAATMLKHATEPYLIPENVFDASHDVEEIYRFFVKIVHPDKNPNDTAMAEEAFKNLSALYTEAKRKVADGTYGKPMFVITTKTGQYEVGAKLADGDLSVVYNSTHNGSPRLLKVARLPQDRDLLQNEAQLLQIIGKNSGKMSAFFPQFVESLAYTDTSTKKTHQVNVFTAPEGSWYTVEQLHKLFLVGLDPKNVAWITRRILMAYSVIHELGIIII